MAGTRNRRRLFAALLGIVSSAVFVALSVRRIDLHGLWQALLTSHWWPWYVAAPLVYAAGLWVRGMRCRAILRPHCDLSNLSCTNVVTIGYAANNVLPARIGELVRAYVLSQKAGLSVSLSLAVTFLERIFDGLAITLILVLAGFLAPLPAWGREILWIALAVFAGATAAVVAVMVAKPLVLSLFDRATRWLPRHIAERLLGILDKAIAATDCLRTTSSLAAVALLSVAVWVIEGTMFMLVLPGFGLPLNPIWAGMAVSVTNLGILIPSSPGYVGPFHYFCMRTLLIFGVQQEIALGYAIIVHILSYIPVTLWGLSALAVYGIDLGAAARVAPAAVVDGPALAVEPKA